MFGGQVFVNDSPVDFRKFILFLKKMADDEFKLNEQAVAYSSFIFYTVYYKRELRCARISRLCIFIVRILCVRKREYAY